MVRSYETGNYETNVGDRFRKKILWDSKKRRNEALDCFVYALAALRISISRWQLDLSALLASLQEEDGAATNKKTLADYARALSGEDE
ncbi:terminase [Escherichia coli]|nr:terminase [Escherichia coli]